ncbi:hypothetical protein KKG46_01185 [Patescibacteria group bacterium]|nr:hypothetical protein [Patescibacteria group bacterium]
MENIKNTAPNTEYAVSLGCTSLHPYLLVMAHSVRYYITSKHRIFWNVIGNIYQFINKQLMIKYITVSIVNGFLFGVMDGIINANPFAQKLFEAYKPIAKTSINAPAGIFIDLIYGFALGAIFLLIYPSLPGESGLTKGIIFALILWFLRVFMHVASTWMMLDIPVKTLSYVLITGLIEMLVIGIVYGIFLKPIK